MRFYNFLARIFVFLTHLCCFQARADRVRGHVLHADGRADLVHHVQREGHLHRGRREGPRRARPGLPLGGLFAHEEVS